MLSRHSALTVFCSMHHNFFLKLFKVPLSTLSVLSCLKFRPNRHYYFEIHILLRNNVAEYTLGIAETFGGSQRFKVDSKWPETTCLSIKQQWSENWGGELRHASALLVCRRRGTENAPHFLMPSFSGVVHLQLSAAMCHDSCAGGPMGNLAKTGRTGCCCMLQ